MYRKLVSLFSLVAVLAALVPSSAFADEANDSVEAEEVVAEVQEQAPEDRQIPRVSCEYEHPGEDPVYGASVVSVNRKMKVEEDEQFQVKFFVKNTGNTPWFSSDSRCDGPMMSMGTDKMKDRRSRFHIKDESTGWVGVNRIKMDQLRINPGEIASFTAMFDAGDDAGVYSEFFTPVLKGIMWLDEASTSFGIIVGDVPENSGDAMKKVFYANHSGSLDSVDLSAEKVLLVDRSDQKVFVKLGDYVVRELPASTGAYSTPTPIGTTTITLKQKVRIGNSRPHYIMPNFMWFRAGGYGFHALPSLGSAELRTRIKRAQAAGEPVPTEWYHDDVMWTEALDHIGTPVSHGCVRLLPEDSDFLFSFTDIGTKVVVQH